MDADAGDASDVLVARSRQVRVAVATLAHALGNAGGVYLRHVHKWERGLDPSAAKLKAFPTALQKCGAILQPAALHGN